MLNYFKYNVLFQIVGKTGSVRVQNCLFSSSWCQIVLYFFQLPSTCRGTWDWIVSSSNLIAGAPNCAQLTIRWLTRGAWIHFNRTLDTGDVGGNWILRILEDTEYLECKITLSTKPLTEVTHASSQYKNDKQSISGFGLQLENDERDH